MAIRSPYRVALRERERRLLTRRSRAERVAHRDVLRARVVHPANHLRGQRWLQFWLQLR